MKDRFFSISLLVLFFLVPIFSLGCAQSSPSGNHLPARDSGVMVYIHPQNPESYRNARVAVLSFRVPANHEQSRGESLGAMFRDILLAKEIFPLVRLVPEHYGNLEQAIRIGRRAEVDLVLAGSLDRAIDATELGGARASISLRVINVHTGNTVWHLAQSIDQPVDHHRVDNWSLIRESFTVPTIRPSQGAPPLVNMLAVIAANLAETMTRPLLRDMPDETEKKPPAEIIE